jgi:TatA/E family protein of Tat protein translocase
MNILGVGPMELALIVVIAVIVLGPEKLPEFMATIGRVYSEFRRATSQLTDDFNRTLKTELNEGHAAIQQAKDAPTDVRAGVEGVASSTQAAAGRVAGGVGSPPAPVQAPTGAEGRPLPGNGDVRIATIAPVTGELAISSWEAATPSAAPDSGQQPGVMQRPATLVANDTVARAAAAKCSERTASNAVDLVPPY